MYELKLTDREVSTLAWLTNRGYFPAELFDEMYTSENDPELWLIPEHAAWSLLDLREDDPDAYLTCLGDPLLSKILKLESEII